MPTKSQFMTTIKLEFCKDRRRVCRQSGETIRDRFYTEDIPALLARIGEQIRLELQQASSQVAVVVHAASAPTSLLSRRSPEGTHLTTAVATVEAPLPEKRIRWTAEAVAALNRLYVRPGRVNPRALNAV
jgi:hypothetical protein